MTCSALGCSATENLTYCGFCSTSKKPVWLCPAHNTLTSPRRIAAAAISVAESVGRPALQFVQDRFSGLNFKP